MKWRPGPDTAIAIAALLIAAAGTSWAVTQDSSPTLSACSAPASGPNAGQLTVVTGATCPAGDTLEASWNQQGPQGAPGLAGAQGPPGSNAPIPVTGYLHQVFHSFFRISYTFTQTGTYDVEGQVTEDVNTNTWGTLRYQHRVLGITCDMDAGPTAPAVRLDTETQAFNWFGGTLDKYFPTSVNSPEGAGGVLKVTSLPYTAWYRCYTGIVALGNPNYVPKYRKLPGVTFVDPQITANVATTPRVTVSKVVGPIFKPTPSPGPIRSGRSGG